MYHPLEELAFEQKMGRVCELLEQLALEAIIAVLEKTTNHNYQYHRQKKKNEYSDEIPF